MRPWGAAAAAAADKGNKAAAAKAGDFTRESLNKKRIKVLRKMLKEQFGDKCKGCLEKEHFVDRIVQLTSDGGGGSGDGGTKKRKDEL